MKIIGYKWARRHEDGQSVLWSMKNVIYVCMIIQKKARGVLTQQGEARERKCQVGT